jgi:hypothetical protein
MDNKKHRDKDALTALIAWSNDMDADVDLDGNIWFNGHWGNADELGKFEEWRRAWEDV